MESVFIVSPLPTASIFFWLGDVCLLVVPSQKVYEKKTYGVCGDHHKFSFTLYFNDNLVGFIVLGTLFVSLGNILAIATNIEF